jgi:hypothetical protein
MSEDEYLSRVALHGSIPDDVPEDIEVTNEEPDVVVEILYIRPRKEYGVYSRHHQTLFLDHGGGGPFDEFEDALELAIETARSEDLPLLQRVYTYAPENEAEKELGAERIPIPWEEDDENSGK